MTFDVKSARSAGYSDDEIADHLGQQSNFDVPAARKSGYGTNEIIDHLSGSDTPAAQRDLVDGIKPSTAGAGRGITRPAMGLADARPSAAPTKGRSGSVLENVILDDPQLDPDLNRQAMLQSRSPNSVMFTAGRGKQEADQAIEQGAKLEALAKKGRYDSVPDMLTAQTESANRKKFAKENPNIGAVASGAANMLKGSINAPSAMAGFVNKTVVDPVLGMVGVGPMPNAPIAPGTDELSAMASDYMPAVAKLPMGKALDSGVFGEWLAANVSAQVPQLGGQIAGVINPVARAAILPTMGAQAAGNSFAEGDDPRVAVAKGVLEVLSEGASFGVADKIKDAILKIPQGAQNAVFANIAKRAMAAGGAVTGQMLAGAIEESVAQVGGNALDIYASGQKKPLTDKVGDSAVIGAFAEAGMGLPNAATALKDNSPRVQVARELAETLNGGGFRPQPGPRSTTTSPSAEQIARQKGFLAREQRIKTLTEAGDTATADLLQKKHDRLTAVEAVDGELQAMPSTPEFAQSYRSLRGTGMKPAEAAARSAVATTFQGLAVTAGIPNTAMTVALEKANGMPLDEAPAFLQKFTAALEKRGMAQPGLVDLGVQLEAARDDAIEAAMGAVYQQGDIRSSMNDVLAMEGQGAPEAVDLQPNQPLDLVESAQAATESVAQQQEKPNVAEATLTTKPFDSTHAATAALYAPENTGVREEWNKSQFTTHADGSQSRLHHDFFEDYHENSRVTAELGSQYDGHGIAKTNPLGALLNILTNGISRTRRFDSAPLVTKAGQSDGLGSASGAYKDGPFILLGERGKLITDAGVHSVLVADSVASIIPELQKRFPSIRFIPHSQANEVLSSDSSALTEDTNVQDAAPIQPEAGNGTAVQEGAKAPEVVASAATHKPFVELNQAPSQAEVAPEVSRYNGKFGKGMNRDAARIESQRLNNTNDGVKYAAEEHNDSKLESPYAVVGRKVGEQKQPLADPSLIAKSTKAIDTEHIGRNSKPLAEGGKPFKTREDADAARKLQPMMRRITVKGGFALAPKTEKQIAAQDAAARRLSIARTGQAGVPMAAHEFIAGEGGMDASTKTEFSFGNNPRVGNRTLFAGARGGMSLDAATEKLVEAGYLPQGASHSDTVALVNRSFTVPQHTAEGTETLADADASQRFEDHLSAEIEASQQDDFDPFGPVPDQVLMEEVGYDKATPEVQAEFRALISLADASGIDAESIQMDVASQVGGAATEQDYYEAAVTALKAAIEGSTRNGSEVSGRESQATAGQASSEGLTTTTPEQVKADEERATQAEKAAKTKKRTDDELARKEQERKDIAARSESAADSFVLGGDAMQNLSGQGSMFDEPTPPISKTETTAKAEKPAAKTPSPEELRAQADLQSALADLGDIFGKGTRLNMMPEQEAKILPVMVKLFDAAFRLGYHKFKDAAKFTLDKIRAALGDAVADDITLEHLQGAYISMSSGKTGTDGIRAVSNIESKSEVEAHTAQTENERTGESNAPSTDSRVERDRQGAATESAVGDPVSPEPRGTDAATPQAGGRANRSTGRGQLDGVGLSSGGTAAAGNGSNQRVPGGISESELASVTTGDQFSERGASIGISGIPPEPIPAKLVTKAAQSFDGTLTRSRAQKAAANVKPITGDLQNIRDTLPQLLSNQQEDVHVAEQRFAKADGYGMLFTNGTGTGKTFSGLGIIKRHELQGKTNTLILAPDTKIASDWIKSGKLLGLNITELADTKDAGKGIVITTYANIGANDAVATRQWDLVVADEAHTLMQDKDGTPTSYLHNLRAITYHPDGAGNRHTMLNRDKLDKAKAMGEEILSLEKMVAADSTTDAQRNAWEGKSELLQKELGALRKQLQESQKAMTAEVATRQGATRPRLVALSATPFAYEKTIDWGNGYLFDYNEGRGDESKDFRGYNVGSNREQYFMQHFGYSMRVGKLTTPDARVDSGLMQRQWNGNLKKSGSLSGRMLDVVPDYDRRFVTVDSAIGNRIDEALEWLTEQRRAAKKDDDGFSVLSDAINAQFKYLQKRYLLEAIKATEVIPIVKAHLAMGRKVVVFHDYKKGGGFNPFAITPGSAVANAGAAQAIKASNFNEALAAFNAKFGDLVNSNLGAMDSPIEIFSRELPQTLLVNGDEKPKDLLKRYDLFQDDASGPQVMLVQSAKNKGWSGHDTTGKHQRVLINLGQPTAPTTAIQQEGRIYRTGQASDAIMRYLNTGTNWERWTFASTIAGRASTAENLGMGEMARALKDSFIQSFEESDTYAPGHKGEGKGGKERDKAANDAVTEYDRAKSMYFATQKKNSQTKAQEGVDYFATPEPVGLKMVQWLDARPDESTLEPSAGHGAISRWLPDVTKRTVVEPSMALRSRLALAMNPNEDRIIAGTFEDLDVTNKYDGIVMNPPFGTAGRTAVDHIAKAATHLRDGGRIVALLPMGSATAKFDKWFYESSERAAKPLYTDENHGPIYKGDTLTIGGFGKTITIIVDKVDGRVGGPRYVRDSDTSPQEAMNSIAIDKVQATGPRTESFKPAEGLHMVASIQLPQVTFERAGTAVATRIVVIEKQTDSAKAPASGLQDRDLSNITDITELFDRLENIEMPKRDVVATVEPAAPAKAEKPARAAKPAAAPAAAVGDQISMGGKQYPVEVYTTNAGKELRGVWVGSKAEALKYGPSTFEKRGKGFFVRERDFPKTTADDDFDSPMLARGSSQTDTPAFKKWFGDSKVVDDEGKPLVVYHGSKTAGITEFNTSAENNGGERGTFFSAKKSATEDYGSSVYESYLSIKNPYEVTSKQWSMGEGMTPVEARGASHDGYIIRGLDGKDGDAFIAFNPTQIKSATGNRGTFGSKPSAFDGNVDSFSAEVLSDGLAADADFLRNFASTRTFKKFGLDGFDIPSNGLVFKRVSSVLQDFKIRDAVIKLIPVDVMNILISQKLSPDVLLNDVSVLSDLLSTDSDNPVTLVIGESTKVARAIAGVTAKYLASNSDLRVLPTDRNSAMGTQARQSDALVDGITGVRAKNPSALRNTRSKAADDGRAIGAVKGFHDGLQSGEYSIAYNADSRLSTIENFDTSNPDIRYKRSQPAPSGQSVADTQAQVNKITAKQANGPRTIVVATPADLPVDAPSDARGMYLRGTVYIVASNNFNAREVASTLAHETIAHHGLRNMLGRDDWLKLMGNIQLALASGNKPLNAIRADIRKAYVDENGVYNLNKNQESDEITARAVEDAIDENGEFKPGFGFMKSVYAKLAQALRDLGFTVAFTNVELQGMLVSSMRNLETGARTQGGGSTVVAMSRGNDGGVTMSEIDALNNTPTVDIMREAVDAVGETEFKKRVQKKTNEVTSNGKYPESASMLVEATAREIVAISRRSTAPDSGGAFARGRSPQANLFQPTGWSMPDPTKLDRAIYEVQDGKIDLKRAQQAIEASGQNIEEKWDARLSETVYPGRVAHRSQQFLDTEVKPLLDAMARNKLDIDELADYLHARGAQERNKQIAKVNPAMPDGGAGTNTKGELMTNQAAADYLAALRPARKQVLDAMAKRVDAITKGTRALLVTEGLEKQSTIDAWEGAYKNYVPMFRDEAEAGIPHPQGSGFTVKGSASRRATGSTKEVTNILAHVLMQREAAMTRAEKNRVALSLYGMAMSHPNPDFWTTIKPSMKPTQIAAELTAMGVNPMTAQVGMEGVPTIRTVDPITNTVVDRPNPMYKTLPGAITLRVHGEDRVVMLNVTGERGQRLAESLKNMDGLTAIDWSVGVLHRYVSPKIPAKLAVGPATRWLASVNTQYNPAFGLVNVTRDILGAAVNLGSTQLRGKSLEVLAKTPVAVVGIARELYKGGQGGKWQKLYREFQEDGGQTGFKENFRDPNDRAKAIVDEMKRLGKGKLSPSRAAHMILDLLDGFNTTLENAVRVSAYSAARDNGMSRANSARLGRELTVDFNRKGRMGREMGPLYAFFNAAVQGTARTMEAINGPTGGRIVAGGLTLGALQVLALAMAGYDDDEIPEFVKARSLVIPTGTDRDGKRTHIMIPYPLGLHVIPNTGRVLAELGMNGGKDIGKRTADAIGEIAGAFNPLGGGNIFTADGALRTVAPTVIDPIIELGFNKNFAGNSIEKEPYGGERDMRPGVARTKEATMRSTTGQVYMEISKTLNSMTGGTDYEKGAISHTPERIRYLAQTVGGGVLRELEKAINTSTAASRGEPVKSSGIPVVGRFYGEVDDDAVQKNRYFRTSDKLSKLNSSYQAMVKAGDGQAIEKFIGDNPEIAMSKLNSRVGSSIAKLNKLAVQTVGNIEASKQIDDARVGLMRAMNEAVDEMEATTRKPTLADMIRPRRALEPVQ